MPYSMLKTLIAAAAVSAIVSVDVQAQKPNFFITSVGMGHGAALGGLEGADRHCQQLAEAAGITGMAWHAYLSTGPAYGKAAVHARDRIGKGPWRNVKGVVVAQNLDDLHSDNNKLSKENSLTEKGTVVNGRGDTPNMHDILTGTGLDGRFMADTVDTTCNNWSSSNTGSALVAHHDRQGGGTNPTSWVYAHASRGCSQENLQASGGNGLFYCFAM